MIPKWLRLHDPGPPRMWRIGYALAACFLIALAGLAVLWLAAWALLGNPHLAPAKGITVHDTVGVAQLVFASVAGAGALVALVVAYRRQRVAEDRTPVFNERFATIVTQLGDGQPAVRLAGAYAMAGLADDWVENRQTCVDVLCAYLRLPYTPDPGEDADLDKRIPYLANREVRHTIIHLIGTHLRPGAAVSWQGLNLDFTGVVFDGGDFRKAVFSGGEVSFDGAVFSRDTADFREVDFREVDFREAVFSGAKVSFRSAVFSGGTVDFGYAVFSGSEVYFHKAKVSGGTVRFAGAEFSGTVDFGYAEFSSGEVSFDGAKVSGGTVSFDRAAFSGAKVSFTGAKFSDGTVYLGYAEFSGGEVSFGHAEFSGGMVDFSNVGDWSHPPTFDWDGTPPLGVMLPASPTGTSA
jgi:uncharacterized protein YjbI with pentapeptide repeats